MPVEQIIGHRYKLLIPLRIATLISTNQNNAVRIGSNAYKTRSCLSSTFPRSSFMFEWRELTMTSA